MQKLDNPDFIGDLNMSSDDQAQFFRMSAPVWGESIEINDQHKLQEVVYISFELAVQDFGVGIPADQLKNLFINFGTLDDPA